MFILPKNNEEQYKQLYCVRSVTRLNRNGGELGQRSILVHISVCSYVTLNLNQPVACFSCFQADMMKLKEEMQERLRRLRKEQEKKRQMKRERRRRQTEGKNVRFVVPEEVKNEPGVLSMLTLSNIALSFQTVEDHLQ